MAKRNDDMTDHISKARIFFLLFLFSESLMEKSMNRARIEKPQPAERLTHKRSGLNVIIIIIIIDRFYIALCF